MKESHSTHDWETGLKEASPVTWVYWIWWRVFSLRVDKCALSGWSFSAASDFCCFGICWKNELCFILSVHLRFSSPYYFFFYHYDSGSGGLQRSLSTSGFILTINPQQLTLIQFSCVTFMQLYAQVTIKLLNKMCTELVSTCYTLTNERFKIC